MKMMKKVQTGSIKIKNLRTNARRQRNHVYTQTILDE